MGERQESFYFLCCCRSQGRHSPAGPLGLEHDITTPGDSAPGSKTLVNGVYCARGSSGSRSRRPGCMLRVVAECISSLVREVSAFSLPKTCAARAAAPSPRGPASTGDVFSTYRKIWCVTRRQRLDTPGERTVSWWASADLCVMSTSGYCDLGQAARSCLGTALLSWTSSSHRSCSASGLQNKFVGWTFPRNTRYVSAWFFNSTLPFWERRGRPVISSCTVDSRFVMRVAGECHGTATVELGGNLCILSSIGFVQPRWRCSSALVPWLDLTCSGACMISAVDPKVPSHPV